MNLASFPRRHYTPYATPIEPMPRFSAELATSCPGGRGPEVWVKRDDLLGLFPGGNKTRKLEFLVADARSKEADTLITSGATQSNHARMTAAAACVAGLNCHLVLTAEDCSGNTPPAIEGNLLLDHLYGATVHHVSDKDRENADDEKIRGLQRDLRLAGNKPYVIPVGGSNALGVLGYVLASLELADQLAFAGLPASRLYYASGSRGTQAGLALGAKLCGAAYSLYGVAVSADSSEKPRAPCASPTKPRNC